MILTYRDGEKKKRSIRGKNYSKLKSIAKLSHYVASVSERYQVLARNQRITSPGVLARSLFIYFFVP